MPINPSQLVGPNEGTATTNIERQALNSIMNPGSGYTTNVGATAITLTAAQLTVGRNVAVINITGITSATTATLDTVANLVAQLQSVLGPNVNVVGLSWIVRVVNTATTFTATVTTSTGWGTLGGTQTVASNTFRDFVVTITSLTTASWQSVGTGTQS
jgi:hypothetical protein